ncbi:hypothetical protein, partial [Priestia megaterium]
MPLQAGVVLADGLGESECHDGVPVSSLGWDRGGRDALRKADQQTRKLSLEYAIYLSGYYLNTPE